jgi:hypothetical protein
LSDEAQNGSPNLPHGGVRTVNRGTDFEAHNLTHLGVQNVARKTENAPPDGPTGQQPVSRHPEMETLHGWVTQHSRGLMVSEASLYTPA